MVERGRFKNDTNVYYSHDLMRRYHIFVGHIALVIERLRYFISNMMSFRFARILYEKEIRIGNSSRNPTRKGAKTYRALTHPTGTVKVPFSS